MRAGENRAQPCLPEGLDLIGIEQIFSATPEVIPLVLETLAWILARWPETPVTVQRSQIRLGPGGGFCWLHRGRKRDFFCSFGLRRLLEHPRVTAIAHPTRTRWTVHTRVYSPADLDGALAGWLEEARRG